jgi:hypothetical protein
MVIVDTVPKTIAAKLIYFIGHTLICLNDYYKPNHMMFRLANRCTSLGRRHLRGRTKSSYRNISFLSLP